MDGGSRGGKKKLKGPIQSIDSFGDLIANIPADALTNVPRGEDVVILCDEHRDPRDFQYLWRPGRVPR